jgi:RNA polymerase sigma factor (sigma-70 family)
VPDTPSAEDLFRQHLTAVERAIHYVCRRRHLSEDEAEEFASEARLKVLEDDAAVLRGFRGESKMETYLVVVLGRFLEDWRRARWGKWRPSAAAVREGTTAILYERLTHRDGIPFEQAAEILRRNHHVDMTVPELAELAGRLPAREVRQTAPEEALAHMPEPRPGPEAEALEREDRARLAEAVDILHRCLDELDGEDRLIVRLYYYERQKIVAVSRALEVPAKPLYRRIEKIRGSLHRCMVGRGADEDTIGCLLRRKSDRGSVH